MSMLKMVVKIVDSRIKLMFLIKIKSRFTTVDIIAIIKGINAHFVGHRAIQIYDFDNRTFLMKLSKSGEEGKTMLLLESGIRMHIAEFDWPKNPSPSGFSMKLRKHIKNRRLESINQIGSDRIVDLQFGTKEYYECMILQLVRPRVDNSQDLKFFARERYQTEPNSRWPLQYSIEWRRNLK